MLSDHPNLVILRTLSKALGFAGARCGAVIGNEAVIRMLNAVQAPYALATPVVECVEDALQEEQLVRAESAVRDVIDERKRVMEAVASFSFVTKLWPSQANFFLIRVADSAAVMKRCADQNILLRDFGGDLSNCIRITIGNQDDNDRLLAALKSLTEVAS